MAAAKTKAKAGPPKQSVTFVADISQAAPGANVLWAPNPGPQTEALLREEYEILYGGSKGGGKTVCGRMWLLSGNPLHHQKTGHPCDISYINHPSYAALVLRLNKNDAQKWIKESYPIYHAMGASLRESPVTEFYWPNGATIVIDHMADDSIWTKYAGNQYQRMVIEEAGQIPNYQRYADVKINCRSSFRELRPQIFLTANPGGPGHGWLMKRFLLDKPDKYKKRLIELRKDPVTGEQRQVTRVFIPARLSDNPKLLETDPDYAVRLASDLSDDPNRKRALLDGDWTALAGTYFSLWRPNGPTFSEQKDFPWARHVIEPCRLEPHWHRWMGMDWGYGHNSACYFACQHPNGQVHIYRELMFSRMTPEEYGVEIALAAMKDLQGIESRSMTLWLSPDCWDQRTSERTVSDMIRDGINSVLGPQAAYVMSTEDMHELDAGGSYAPGSDFWSRRAFQRQAAITIRKAQNQRVAGWQYMHSLMRFKPLVNNESKFDQSEAMRILHDEGSAKYFEYLRAYSATQETLPKLQIHNICTGLIRSIPTAVHDERHNPEDVMKTDEPEDDCLDACRYLLMAHKYHVNREPRSAYIANRIAKFDNGSLQEAERFWIGANAADEYEAARKSAHGFTIPRASNRRARWN